MLKEYQASVVCIKQKCKIIAYSQEIFRPVSDLVLTHRKRPVTKDFAI